MYTVYTREHVVDAWLLSRKPHRAAPPDAQPHRAAPPHTVPRAYPTWIRIPGAIRAPPPPLPVRGLPVLTEPHPARGMGPATQSASSDAGRSSRTILF
jgi:hypothetical protein